MGNRHDRLTKYGIVALAGIAVLGWVREPEKHRPSGSSVSATSPASSAESRSTFYPPSGVAGVAGIDELPADNPRSVHATDTVRETDSPVASVPTGERMKRSPIEVDQRTSAVVKTPAQAPVNSGRHEGTQAIEDGVTRSREPRQEPSENRQASERRVPPSDGALTPRAAPSDDTRVQTQPVMVKKQRSTARSAAIILGTAVAGAAIGAATGGGKGAAIGAVSGSAGGYVYDRMTRHNSVAGVPNAIDKDSDSPSDADQQGDYKRYDRGPSLARRFGTPNFNGR
jgi:hypothetical protein